MDTAAHPGLIQSRSAIAILSVCSNRRVRGGCPLRPEFISRTEDISRERPLPLRSRPLRCQPCSCSRSLPASTHIGLIPLSRIVLRNTLKLIGQIRHHEEAGLDPFSSVCESTVQFPRPVILTALATILAFIPLTHSVFWGTLADTLIGGTFAETILTLVFLPAMYSIWFRIRPDDGRRIDAERRTSRALA